MKGDGAPASDTAFAAPDVGATAQLACLLEASAPKPGNVSPGRPFADLHHEDFLASAAAIGGPMSKAGRRPLGETVRLAIESTHRWAGSNSNLGIVLLLAPLARAACLLLHSPSSGGQGVAYPRDLRAALRRVLDETTVEDARNVYAAIRLAEPGGLGRVAAQDVADEPDVTLLEAMRLASARDGVAAEYATTFEVTFGTATPAITEARRDGLSWNDAIVEAFLILLARGPDTHIVRRSGSSRAAEVSQRAETVLRAGGVRSDAGRRAIEEMDVALRDARNRANPGTTADITAAAIFVVLLGGGWLPPEES